LIVSFETSDLRECCWRIEVAEQQLGTVHAQALVTLIAELEAFEIAAEMLSFMRTSAIITDSDSLLIEVGSDYVATFVPVGVRFGRDEYGRVDWSTVRRLKLTEISKRP
jgi:hypothetical protein